MTPQPSAIAAPGVAAEMLSPGDPNHHARLIVRGLKLRVLRITAVDGASDPLSMAVWVLVHRRLS